MTSNFSCYQNMSFIVEFKIYVKLQTGAVAKVGMAVTIRTKYFYSAQA